MEKFKSTLPARGATQSRTCHSCKKRISIHAPREGSDKLIAILTALRQNFNPRSPRGERHLVNIIILRKNLFQSTLPARGATKVSAAGRPVLKFQSTLPARGATKIDRVLQILIAISIHAPREGSDFHNITYSKKTKISIHAPREGSDKSRGKYPISTGISIHAPREGSDQAQPLITKASTNFNPRSPRGERRFVGR